MAINTNHNIIFQQKEFAALLKQVLKQKGVELIGYKTILRSEKKEYQISEPNESLYFEFIIKAEHNTINKLIHSADVRQRNDKNLCVITGKAEKKDDYWIYSGNIYDNN